MLFARHWVGSRRAVTLIEWLTVAVIIGALAVLFFMLAISGRVLGPRPHPKSAHALKLKQFEMAIYAYKERFGEFPPDGLPTGEYTKQELFEDHIRKAFPDCTSEALAYGWTTYGQYQTPATALVFWLGGVADETGKPIGFSADPANPFDMETTARIGPFLSEFDTDRLSCDPNHEGVWAYYPTVAARQTGDPDWAIRYYRAENGTYADKGSVPFRDSRGSGPAAGDGPWVNPRTFQIISPGVKGSPFVEAGDNPRFPDGPYTQAQFEMMSNFTIGTMEDAMP